MGTGRPTPIHQRKTMQADCAILLAYPHVAGRIKHTSVYNCRISANDTNFRPFFRSNNAKYWSISWLLICYSLCCQVCRIFLLNTSTEWVLFSPFSPGKVLSPQFVNKWLKTRTYILHYMFRRSNSIGNRLVITSWYSRKHEHKCLIPISHLYIATIQQIIQGTSIPRGCYIIQYSS